MGGFGEGKAASWVGGRMQMRLDRQVIAALGLGSFLKGCQMAARMPPFGGLRLGLMCAARRWIFLRGSGAWKRRIFV